MAFVGPISFFPITQDRTDLVEFLHLAGGPSLDLDIRLRVAVRVVLAAATLVGQFDLVASGVRTDAEDFVWIHA